MKNQKYWIVICGLLIGGILLFLVSSTEAQTSSWEETYFLTKVSQEMSFEEKVRQLKRRAEHLKKNYVFNTLSEIDLSAREQIVINTNSSVPQTNFVPLRQEKVVEEHIPVEEPIAQEDQPFYVPVCPIVDSPESLPKEEKSQNSSLSQDVSTESSQKTTVEATGKVKKSPCDVKQYPCDSKKLPSQVKKAPCCAKAEPVAEEVDYWEQDIREQTIMDIERNSKIDKAFQEAKDIMQTEKKTAQIKPAPEKPTPVILTAGDVIRAVIKKPYSEKEIDLDFDDTSLTDIFMTLGEAAQMNIVLDPMLRNNKLDLHLKKVSIEESLLLISQTYDLGFKRIGQSLFVTHKDKLRDQNLISKVIRLKNLNVEEAQVLIGDLLDTVNISEEINSLIVVGEPEEILQIEKLLAQVDRPQPQVILEAKIVELNKDALKDLGVDWSDQITLSHQESGRPVDFDNIEDAPDSAAKIFSVARNPIQFNMVIKMLENQNKAKVLSNPRITTLNDKEAEIFVGDRIPYTVTNVTGGVATTDVRWVEPGIRLAITPTIIENNFVVIKVEPEVSFIFAFRGPNDEFPQVKTREATAYVRVKNNEPFILGGLLNQEDKKNLFKVPMLGDIPLLGNLFSYEEHSVTDTELIITIIPTIVQGES